MKIKKRKIKKEKEGFPVELKTWILPIHKNGEWKRRRWIFKRQEKKKMEISITRRNHLHLQGLELPTWRKREKKQRTPSLYLLGQPTHNKRGGGCFLFYRGRVRFRGGSICGSPRFFTIFFLFKLTTLKDLSSQLVPN